MIEGEVLSGLLTYIKPGPLGKKKVKKFAVLCQSSNSGLPRIELYESKDAYGKKDTLKKNHVHVVNLDQCTNISNDKLNDGKKTDYFVTLHSGSEDKQNTFSFESPDDMNTWLQSLRSVIFGRNDGTDSNFVFKVEIKPNDVSEKLQLRGTYFLSVTPDDIELLDRHSRKLIYKWPLPLLRKYGRDKQEFSLEAGRRCPTGPGMFCFKTDYYNAIFQEVECNIKSHAARSRTESTSSTASFSKSSGKFQVQTDRPASPHISASSVYDDPRDAMQPSNNSSDIYSEPANMVPTPAALNKPRNKAKSPPTNKKDKKPKSKAAINKTPLPSAPKKPPRKASPPRMVAEATYADPMGMDGDHNDLGAEYSHLNIGGNVAVADAEYDSISFSSPPPQDDAYATTTNAPQPTSDDVYDTVQR